MVQMQSTRTLVNQIAVDVEKHGHKAWPYYDTITQSGVLSAREAEVAAAYLIDLINGQSSTEVLRRLLSGAEDVPLIGRGAHPGTNLRHFGALYSSTGCRLSEGAPQFSDLIRCVHQSRLSGRTGVFQVVLSTSPTVDRYTLNVFGFTVTVTDTGQLSFTFTARGGCTALGPSTGSSVNVVCAVCRALAEIVTKACGKDPDDFGFNVIFPETYPGVKDLTRPPDELHTYKTDAVLTGAIRTVFNISEGAPGRAFKRLQEIIEYWNNDKVFTLMYGNNE